MDENDEDISWYSCVCSSGEILFYFNVLTGEHRWTNNSDAVHYSKARLYEVPQANKKWNIRDALKIVQKNGRIPHILSVNTVRKTFKEVATETDICIVEPKKATRTVETQTEDDSFVNKTEINSTYMAKDYESSERTCHIQTAKYNGDILKGESCSNKTTKVSDRGEFYVKEKDVMKLESSEELFTIERTRGINKENEREISFTSSNYDQSDSSLSQPQFCSTDSYDTLVPPHSSLIDNLFAMDSCFNPDFIKRETSLEDVTIQESLFSEIHKQTHFNNRAVILDSRRAIGKCSSGLYNSVEDNLNIVSSKSYELERKQMDCEFRNGDESEENTSQPDGKSCNAIFMVKSDQGAIYIEENAATSNSNTIGDNTYSRSNDHNTSCANDIINDNADKLSDVLSSEKKLKTFPCNVCSKEFKSSNQLSRHHSVHTGEKNHQCSDCGKAFRDNGCLKKHMRIHTGERPYQCRVCLKRFSQSQNLNKHMHTHTGRRPHVCATCAKAFTQHSHLARHVLIHTGQKPYECKQCQISYRTSSHLARHKKGKRHAMMCVALRKEEIKNVLSADNGLLDERGTLAHEQEGRFVVSASIADEFMLDERILEERMPSETYPKVEAVVS